MNYRWLFKGRGIDRMAKRKLPEFLTEQEQEQLIGA